MSLYKGRLSDISSFTGYEYQYYTGFPVKADGTFDLDEVQDRAGTYRFQACQYYEGKPKNYWVCTPYAGLTVK